MGRGHFVLGVNRLRFALSNAGGWAGLVVQVLNYAQPPLAALLPPAQQRVWATGNLPAPVATQDTSGTGAGLAAGSVFETNGWQY